MANLLERYEFESYPGQIGVVCEDDVECGNKYGWGHTLKEAQEAWGEMLVERIDDLFYDWRADGTLSPEVADECFVSIDGLAYLPY